MKQTSVAWCHEADLGRLVRDKAMFEWKTKNWGNPMRWNVNSFVVPLSEIRRTLLSKSKTASFSALLLFAFLSGPPCLAEDTRGGSTNKAALDFFSEGLQKSNSGDYQGSAAAYSKALAADSHYGKAYANRGCARYNMHDYAAAIQDLDAAITYFPDNSYLKELKEKSQAALAQNNDAAAENEQQRLAAARQMLLQAQLGGDFADPSTMIMMAAARHGGASGGTPSIASAVSAVPKTASDQGADLNLTAKDYYKRGCTKNAAQDYANAIPEFSRSIALDPSFGDCYANRGLAEFHVSDFAGALKDFQSADKLIPNNAELKHYIELCHQMGAR